MTRALPLACGLALVALLLVPSAMAEVEGGCAMRVQGEDIAGRDSTARDDAVHVASGDDLNIRITSPVVMVSWETKVHWGPFSFIVPRDADEGQEPSKNTEDIIGVGSFGWIGSGLYRISIEATLEDGGHCQGSTLLDLETPIWVTLAGWVSILLLVGGAAGLATAFIKVLRAGPPGPRP